MMHRHLQKGKENWSLMEIESLFERGNLSDWLEFANALKYDLSIATRVQQVCHYRKPDGAERIALALLDGVQSSETHS